MTPPPPCPGATDLPARCSGTCPCTTAWKKRQTTLSAAQRGADARTVPGVCQAGQTQTE